MVGFRRLKHCSMTLFLFGVAVVMLSYKWFFDQHLHHPLQTLPLPLQQLNLPQDIHLPAQPRQAHSPFSLTLHEDNPLPQNFVLNAQNLQREQDLNEDSEEGYQDQQNDPSENSNFGNEESEKSPKFQNQQSRNNPNFQNQQSRNNPNFQNQQSRNNPNFQNQQSRNNPNFQNQDHSNSRTHNLHSQNDASSQNSKPAKDPNPSKHVLKAFPSSIVDKPQREKDIAKRIISQKRNTHGKRVLREDEDEEEEEHTYLENRGPSGVTHKMDVRRLHRSFSLAALKSGNMYTSSNNEPGSRVIHVVVFASRDAFMALMTLVNSVVKNASFRNVSFHFVTASAKDRMTLKKELEQSPLSRVAYEIIEYPPEWSQGKDLLEFAPFRLPELLPYMGGRVIVLDPYCLVKGDIADLAETHIKKGHWAAMATLCNTDPSSPVPEERYRNYLNFSHEAIAKLRLSPDTCVPSPAVMVVSDLNVIRLANPRRKLWQWMHQNDKSPVFLKTQQGTVSSKAPYTVVYHNHTSLLKPQWYTRVSEKSPVPDSEQFLYHWVGKGKPWELSSPVSAIWKTFLIRSADDRGEQPVNEQ